MIFKMIMRQFLLFHNNYNFNFFGGSCSTSRRQNDEVECKKIVDSMEAILLEIWVIMLLPRGRRPPSGWHSLIC